MWKEVYTTYKNDDLDFKLYEETLKESLQETLRELKTKTSNQEGLKRVVLDYEEVLTHLKPMDAHSMHNVLKRLQSLIDDTNLSTPSNLASTPAFNLPSMYVDLEIPLYGPNVTSRLPSTSTLLENTRMKAYYLQNQSRNIEQMASIVEVDLQHHVLLQAQMQITKLIRQTKLKSIT